jgi:hypothetical protein
MGVSMERNGDSVDKDESTYRQWELSQTTLDGLRRAAAAGNEEARKKLETDGEAMQAEIDRLARARSEVLGRDFPRYEE